MSAFSHAFAVGALAVFATAAPALADTVVTSPAGLFTNPTPANAAGPGAGPDTWFANNVRNGGAAGITGTYARSGNGSIEFQSPQSGALSSKADFEYYFSPANQFSLSSLTSFGYDFYRDSASTNNPLQHPSLRLYVSNGQQTGYLVYEGIYNGVPIAPTDTWTHVDVVGGAGSKYIWATGNLPDNFNTAAPNYTRTAADWAALLPNLQVLGFSTGVGSGWDGAFRGAVDNISFSVAGGPVTTFNFEARATPAVPEPATWAMMIVGFGAVGASMRYRRRATAATLA